MTAVASSATIPPGASGHILVTIKGPMAGMPGVLLIIPSNDPVEPEQTLLVKFQSVP